MTQTETTIPPSAQITMTAENPPVYGLSDADEQRLQDSLLRNNEVVVVARSVANRTVSHGFPLYFGTTEIDFADYRRRALHNRRTSHNPHYPEGELSADHRLVLPSNLKVKIRTPRRPETPQMPPTEAEKPVETAEELQANTEKESTPVAEPTTVTEPTPETPHTPAQQATQTPRSAMRWSEAIQSSMKKATAVKTTATPPSTSASTLLGSPATPTTSLVTPEPLRTAESPPSSPDTAYVPDNSVKPIGLVALKLMYDRCYLPFAISSNKDELVIPHGLVNSGNICYMNSVLQMLFECEPFSQLLNIVRKTTPVSFEATKTPLIDALLLLHDDFKKKSEPTDAIARRMGNDVANPFDFFQVISKLDRFRTLEWGKQEDAEEFLGYLLDGLHEEFVGSIGNVSEEDAKELANELADDNSDASQRVLAAVKAIKTTGNNGDSREETGDDGWNEVGASRRLATKRTFEFKPSPIAQLFGGQFRSILQTPGRKASITLDPFMHVQLDISDPQTVDLVSAFKKFSEVEEINLGNQKAKKQNLIDRLPYILIIHLKRFSFVTVDDNESSNGDYEIVSSKRRRQHIQVEQAPQGDSRTKPVEGRIEKIHKRIRYDHNLELPQSSIALGQKAPDYRLIGVIYHHGRTAEGGHYTADVRDSSGDWIRIDDTQVSKITPDEVIENGIGENTVSGNNKTAYLLMYEKC